MERRLQQVKDDKI